MKMRSLLPRFVPVFVLGVLGVALPLASLSAAPDNGAPRLAGELIIALADGGPHAAMPALSRIEIFLNGAPTAGTAQSLRPLEEYFRWASQQSFDDPRLARVTFLPGEQLAGGLWYATRVESAGGLQLAMTGQALIAIRHPGEPAVALRHDFHAAPLLTLPVAAGSEVIVLPLGGETSRGPVTGVSAFDPLYPCALAGFSAEPLDDGRTRAVVLHIETDNEQDIARFEIERAARPGAAWRVIAAIPATGGGDYHVIDSRFPGRAFYRLVPVLTTGLRGVPLAMIAAGNIAAK